MNKIAPILLITALASAIVAVLAADYPTIMTLPIQMQAGWDIGLTPDYPRTINLPWLLSSSWSADLTPNYPVSTALPIGLQVDWDIGLKSTEYGVSAPYALLWLAEWSVALSEAAPTALTSNLGLASMWRMSVPLDPVPDYRGVSRVFEFYRLPESPEVNIVDIPQVKKHVDGSVSVYVNGPAEFFYNYTGDIYVENGNATRADGGWIIRTGGGTVTIYDVVQCIVTVTDRYGSPTADRIYFDGAERPTGQWFPCLNGKTTRLEVPDQRIGRVVINGVSFLPTGASHSEHYLANFNNYTIRVITKLGSSIRVEEMSAERLGDGSVRISISGTASDTKYGQPIAGALVFVRVEGRDAGALLTDGDGRFSGRVTAPFKVSPYVDRLSVELVLSHADYEAATASQTVTLPAATTPGIPSEMLLLIVLPVVLALALAAAKKGREATYTMRPRRRVLREAW